MKKYLIPILCAVAFFIIGLLTISDYGINWDSSIHFLRGQGYVNFLLTGKKDLPNSSRSSPRLINPDERISRYHTASGEETSDKTELLKTDLPKRPLPRLEFEKEQIRGQKKTFFEHPAWDAGYFLGNDIGHLPLVDIISAFSNKIFYQTFNLLSDIESYQLINILIASLGVFVVAIFAKEITNSNFAGIIAAFALALFPIFFSEAHINGKDPLQASFFAGTVWVFWKWVRENKVIWGIGFIGFIALALAVKWNIVFLPLIILPWLFTIRKTKEFKDWFQLRRLGILGGLGILGVFLFLIITWPAAWFDPFKLFRIVDYYFNIGVGLYPIQPEGFILPFGFNFYPLALLLTQTPEIILVFMGIGIFSAVKTVRGIKVGYLLLFWLFVPIIRISLPNIWFYGGIRQFMEVLPAMAILAGVGAEYLISNLKSQMLNLQLKSKIFKSFKFSDVVLSFTICVLSLFILLFPIIKLHPNENIYFNSFVGGLSGAIDRNLVDWTLTHGNIYKQGVLWLNEHAEKDANLVHLDGTMFAIPLNILRSDISISPNHFSGFEQKGEYIISLVDPANPAQFAYRFPSRFLRPVYQIQIDRVTMINIYKNISKNLKKDLTEESIERINIKLVKGVDRDYFEIDLEKEVSVTKIEINVKGNSCAVGNNELIAFRKEANLKKKITTSELYKSSEIKSKNSHQVEFLFPGEKAKVIQIFPENTNSCFLKGRITSISFLQE